MRTEREPGSGRGAARAAAGGSAEVEGVVARPRPCPTCGRDTVRQDPASGESRPFCSRACKLADLGAWLGGSYRLAGPPGELDAPLGEDECGA
ncbi:MAG: DNA gyrase inhibitor YacG [Polyangiaceae bacterium]|nr:DNA gyrase inhibitor YacG [Polyangiaceae bacterium]